jgi:micrococcal nuclease
LSVVCCPSNMVSCRMEYGNGPRTTNNGPDHMAMKRFIALTFVWFLFFLAQPARSADTWNQVKWVIDGDTVVLNDGRKVRYLGINAPELEHDGHQAEPFAEQAKRFNASLVCGKEVCLEFDKERTDQYGRTLAYLILRDGTLVNAEILSYGYAFLFYHPQNRKYDSILLRAQRAAMSAKKGIWKDWREIPNAYLGNKQSRRFHLSTCVFAKRIKPLNRIVFQRQWDAYWEGYAPAKQCMPEFKIPKD